MLPAFEERYKISGHEIMKVNSERCFFEKK